jgi:hypothetical protein
MSCLPAENCEVNTGLAACAVQQGHLDKARTFVNKAWDYLQEMLNLFEMGNPGWAFHSCAETFDALG